MLKHYCWHHIYERLKKFHNFKKIGVAAKDPEFSFAFTIFWEKIINCSAHLIRQLVNYPINDTKII